MKKVIIIGGGIAGLTAAVYAQQSGFETEIYEKNAMVGGECTGWNRQGYHIDNCIHWLTGCNDSDDLNEIWRNIGAINDDTPLYREPYFYKYETDGISLHFWRDLEKAKAEFLSVAPEDKKEITKFFDSVKKSECLKVPCKKSLAEMSPFEYMGFGMSMADMGKVMNEYGKETVGDLARRFKNPYIQKMISCYFPESYKAITLFSSYGFYSSGTGAIPSGGSVGMVNRIVKRYEELGGKIHLNMPAEKINIEDKSAVSVTFADGSTIPCDYVISAADGNVTFGKLLNKKYMDKKLRKMYNDRKDYPVMSGYHASFGIVGEEDHPIEGSMLFPCEGYCVGTQTLNTLGVRMYDYDSSIYPKNRRVIQCNVLQNESDFDFWAALYQDKERYNAEKNRIAEDMKARIINKYPELDGRLVLLCTYSPVTFVKWCGAYKGAYMSFLESIGSKSYYIKNSIKGLSNVFAASQWLQTNGGLPSAAASGKFAVDALKKANR